MPAHAFKDNPVTREYEEKAKNLLKAELKRRGMNYADLATRLAEIGVNETERNLANKISRGGFTAAFFVQCLAAIGAASLQLRND
jgi:predicted AAA+ superfamily ATPase